MSQAADEDILAFALNRTAIVVTLDADSALLRSRLGAR